MELGGHLMCDLGLGFDDGDGFNFGNSQTVTYLPSRNKSSSYASSLGPYTPTSGRSTPPGPGSMDFAHSFGDSYSFEPTPPSSAVSTYFPMGLKTEDASNFFTPSLPVTPSRNQLDFSGLPYHDFACQLPSSQAPSLYSFPNDIGPSPFVPTPTQTGQVGETWEESWTAWAQSDSPITFKPQPSPEDSAHQSMAAAIQNQEEGMTPPFTSGVARRRLFIGDARQKSTALQRVQGVRTRPKPAKVIDSFVSEEGFAVQKIPSGRFRCDHPQCSSKQYKRMEHLKRHMKSKHGKEEYRCEFCLKTFNRNDNRRQHQHLHTLKDRRAPRVKWADGAEQALEEELKQIRTRRRVTTNKKRTTI
ncbi:hypothetical protein B0T24DRAFT_326901 [Lasiosphaeria ovina]|uniref:C2H2-type domain-containing protein n=1 Tax=Lasiosphaeria ovina TaxID=92902 RepID=A0AAE0N6T7_9PEZI|nr:hypothetical protein B0T24DRAFT_326901 [Lasiosphaeria ovina]